MPWEKTPADRRQDSQRYGPEWRRARKRQLEADGYRCQLGLDVCTYRATEVDHIDGAANDPHHRRLRSVCGPCHRKHTAQQGGGARGRRANADPEPRQSTLW
jgi:5-methylcytosine-specific restriction endonuclease McrA